MSEETRVCWDDQKWLPNRGRVTSLDIRRYILNIIVMGPLTLLCLMLIKSFPSACIRLIASECVEPNDTSYNKTVSIFSYVKIYTVCFFFFLLQSQWQCLLPKVNKSHKSIINHLRCPQPDTLPTGTTATCCHMASCQGIIYQCSCKRPRLATRPYLLFSPVTPLILTLNSYWSDLYQGPVCTGRLHWRKLPPPVWNPYVPGGGPPQW